MIYQKYNDIVGLRDFILKVDDIDQIVQRTNYALRQISNFETVDIIECLGLKNLSGLVGECFINIITEIIPNPQSM